MIGRVVVVGCWLAGLSLLGLAGYGYFNTASDPAFSVAESALKLGDCPVGEEKEVLIRLLNHSGHPMRVLGLVPC